MRYLALILLALSAPIFALDGIYLGAEIGQVGVTGNLKAPHGNTIGFEADLGLRTTALLDLVLNYHYSAHNNNLKVQHAIVSADLHLFEYSDFEFLFGVGPGFYFFKTSDTETKFGLQFSGAGQLVIEDFLRVGLGAKWNNVFDASRGDGYWTVMLRVGFVLEI